MLLRSPCCELPVCTVPPPHAFRVEIPRRCGRKCEAREGRCGAGHRVCVRHGLISSAVLERRAHRSRAYFTKYSVTCPQSSAAHPRHVALVWQDVCGCTISMSGHHQGKREHVSVAPRATASMKVCLTVIHAALRREKAREHGSFASRSWSRLAQSLRPVSEKAQYYCTSVLIRLFESSSRVGAKPWSLRANLAARRSRNHST